MNTMCVEEMKIHTEASALTALREKVLSAIEKLTDNEKCEVLEKYAIKYGIVLRKSV